MTRARSVTLTSALLALMFAPAARAEVVLVPVCESPAMSAVTDALASRMLRDGVAVRVTPRRELSASACPSHLRAARAEQLRQGRARFAALDLENAVRLFSTLVHQLDERPVLDGDLDVLLRARAHLGWIALERHDSSAAIEHFTAICRLAPNWQPARGDFPPAVHAGLRDACRTPPPLAVLSIGEAVKGAQVWLDDVERCQAPCEVSAPAGSHFLSLRAGHLRVDRQVQLRTKGVLRIDDEVQPTSATRIAAAVAAADTGALGRELSPLSRDAVVVLREAGEATEAVVARAPFTALAGPLSPSISAAATPPDEAVGRLATAVSAAIASLPSPPPELAWAPAAPGAVEAPPLWTRWWVWSIAAGVVATGVATYFVVSSDDKSLDLRVDFP